ncbi:MAG: glycosyltransferase family 2 protein [Actinomycetes bacterium]
MTDGASAAASRYGARAAVVVVSHDTRAEALACLATLDAAGADEVVLVDAGSRDGTAEAVGGAFPEVVILRLANVGFGRAANAGVAATRAPAVVVANADTRFAPGSVAALADALAADPGLAAAGPRVVYPDGRHQASARRLPSLGTAVGHGLFGLWLPENPWTRRYRLADLDPDRSHEVDWLSGCAVALRREAFDAVGGFDPGYFMYVEDVDLAWRLRQAGWRIATAPAAVVVHRVGASADARRAVMVRAHARSLARFADRAYLSGPRAWLRPLVRVGLAAWVATTLAWDRLVRTRSAGGRSSTGE